MQDLIARTRDGSRRMPALRPLLAACLAIALAACQAASPPSGADAAKEARADTRAVSAASTPTPPSAPVAAPGDAPPPDHSPAPAPASPPVDAAPPAVRAPVADTAQTAPVAATPATPDRAGALVDRCSSDADCEVKDVGSCCGYRPRCLNRDSPTFADEVKARCKAEGRVGHCGIAAVAGCACESGRCVNVTPTDNMLVQ